MGVAADLTKRAESSPFLFRLVVCCVLLPAWSICAAVSEDRGAMIAIHGSVFLVDEKNEDPAKNVWVAARDPLTKELLAKAITNEDGSYTLHVPSPGRILLSASRAGYLTVAAEKNQTSSILLDCRAGRPYTGNDFRLVRAGAVNGRVVDHISEPVEEAEVVATPVVEGADSAAGLTFSSRTDDRGIFRIAGLQPGAYTLRVLPPESVLNYESETREIELSASEDRQGVHLTLRRLDRFPVSGRLSGVAPNVQAGIRLRAERLPAPGPVMGALVEPDGRFDFRFLPEGVYHVSGVPGRHAGRARELSFGVIEVRGPLSHLALHPVAAGGIQGRVRVSAQQPLRGFQLALVSDDGIHVHHIHVDGPEKEFAIPEVVPGHYRVDLRTREAYIERLVARPGSETERGFTVTPGAVTKLEVAVSNQFARLHGTVRQTSGQGESFATVSVHGQRGRHLVRADQKGLFVVPVVVPGVYRVCAWPDISAQATLDRGSWRQAGCESKQLQIDPGFEIQLDLTVTRW